MTEPSIEIIGITKHYENKAALAGIHAEAKPGDIVGLIGRNGAGKSTLLEVVAGLIVPDAGKSRVLGGPSLDMDEGTRARLGFVFQEDELFEWMSVGRHIDFVAGCYPHWNHAYIESLLQDWRIPIDRKVGQLSRGQRQMLGILLALGHEPGVLLLDEPAASLDPVARRDFLRQLIQASGGGTRTTVFSTHIVGDLERIANRIWLLHEGRLTADEDTDTLKERTGKGLEDLCMEYLA